MLVVSRVPRASARVPSALTAAETTTALAIAHTAAGGELPGPGWLLLVALTAYGASALVLGRKTPIRVALPALVGAQVLLHAWLVALTPEHAGHAGPTGHTAHVGHPGGLAQGDGLLGLTWPMLAAHVAAGALAALAWALRRRAVEVLLAWAEGPRGVVLPRRPAAPARTATAPRIPFLLAAPTRGPPVELRAAS